MKIRIKFTKEEPVKYIGHLDIMRFFQRCFNRAGVRMNYSEGFNPHQKMSFAMPLGLGITSVGEYVDCEIADGQNLKEIVENMNRVAGDGFKILDIKKIKTNGSKAMAAVKYAGYEIIFKENVISADGLKSAIESILGKESIEILKKTKSQKKMVDVRKQIIRLSCADLCADMILTAGNDNNLKAETVAELILKEAGLEYQRESVKIIRTDLIADKFISLIDFETED